MNYIPAKDADFNVFFKKIYDYVAQKTGGTQPEWTHIPADVVQGLQEAYTAWDAAYTKTLGEHSSQDTREKQRVRKESEGVLRHFIQNYLYDPPVSAYDRDAMDVPNHDTIRTPHGEPKTRPVIVKLSPLGGRRVQIYFADETTPEKRARPKDANGAVISSTLTAVDVRVTDYKLLTSTELLTRSPWVIELGPEAEGKRFSCALCWQNGHFKGVWSDISSVVVA
ncbi:hypothetical protein FACS1894172_12970 [Spirochaetia bacterium]|nr:hypothetical protein FACS1894164_08060 [Spirochaetia bacterium]GHU33766.1 hypothetical protein FACS1894172_12970 [Spirochaetia bacterium]